LIPWIEGGVDPRIGGVDPATGELKGVPGPLLSYNSKVICVRSIDIEKVEEKK
jgi:hypothetical protein